MSIQVTTSGGVASATEVITVNSSRPTPSAEQPISRSQILADRSLATIASSNFTRRLFFQDQPANIREAICAASTRAWTVAILTSDAKNYTPIAAVDILAIDLALNTMNTTVGYSIDDYIHEADFVKPVVFYIRNDNFVGCKSFWESQWIVETDFCDGMNGIANGTYHVAADSQSLSATAFRSNTSQYAILLYETPTGAVSMLNGTYLDNGGWSWKDMSSSWSSVGVFQDYNLEPSTPCSTSSNAFYVSVWFASKNQGGQYTDTLVCIVQSMVPQLSNFGDQCM